MSERRDGLSVVRINGLAFLIAAVTLFVQVLVHRILSAKLLNNYAFLVIALTMLGFAVSGAVLSRTLPTALRWRRETLAVSTALFVLTTLGVCFFFYRDEAALGVPGTQAALIGGLLRRLPLASAFALPFAFTGLGIGVLLASPDTSTRRVYFFDLVGSALGAFAVIPALSLLGVERALLAALAVLVIGTFICVWGPPDVSTAALAAAGLLIAGAALAPGTVFKLRYPPDSMLAATQVAGSGYELEHVAWDPVARIEVSRIPPPSPETVGYPCLIGPNRQFHTRFRRMLTQNNYAFTFAVDYDGRPETIAGIEDTIYAAAYQARAVARPRVLTIGVGGGFDVLTALRFDAAEVTGVEVNAATVRILRETYRDYFGKWVGDPRVRLVAAEGRHFLADAPTTYDVLQLSGVDSYSGTAGAAHVFSESYLYTSEAFDLYLSRLSPSGVLNVMRLEHARPCEMLRALATAVAALRRAGVPRPAEHVVVLGGKERTFIAVLVKKTPFTAEEEARLAAWAQPARYLVLLASPHRRVEENVYQSFLALGDARRERAAIAAYPVAIEPVSDDRPFFFRFSRWAHVLPGARSTQAPFLEWSLIVLAAVIGMVAVLCVGVPLLVLNRQGLRVAGASRYAVFFGGIGLGYMAVEVALLQKFGLYLGHPNHAVSVVLAALLLWSGLGSLVSASLTARLGGPRFVAYALSGLLFAEYALALPQLSSGLSAPFPVRVLVVFILVAPIGLLLGTFFPLGFERLKETAPPFAPWAWGLNGIFSVLGPILGVAVSTTWGMNALLLAAVPTYLMATWALPAPPRSA